MERLATALADRYRMGRELGAGEGFTIAWPNDEIISSRFPLGGRALFCGLHLHNVRSNGGRL